MNRIVLTFYLLLFTLVSWSQRICGLENELQEEVYFDSLRYQQQVAFDQYTQDWIAREQTRIRDRSGGDDDIYSIPVVVHILWKEEADNIPDQQVIDQINILNDAYRNRDVVGRFIPASFAGQVADVGFEFCLATLGPDGQPTDGITRTQVAYDNIGDFRNIRDLPGSGRSRLWYDELGGKTPWDVQSYLNIYVAPIGSGVQGYGTSPFDPNVQEGEEGIIIDPRYFGNTCFPPYNLGKIAVHEVGHYFNLQHIWGSESTCDADDGVADTPLQEKEHFGCPSFPSISCGSSDMYMNYMDYTDDRCMSMFTEGQRMRMRCALLEHRADLLDSDACKILPPPATETFSVYPNPVRNCLHFSYDGDESRTVLVRLLASDGRIIYEAENSSTLLWTIPVERLTEGVYLLQLQVSGRNEVFPILKLD